MKVNCIAVALDGDAEEVNSVIAQLAKTMVNGTNGAVHALPGADPIEVLIHARPNGGGPGGPIAQASLVREIVKRKRKYRQRSRVGLGGDESRYARIRDETVKALKMLVASPTIRVNRIAKSLKKSPQGVGQLFRRIKAVCLKSDVVIGNYIVMGREGDKHAGARTWEAKGDLKHLIGLVETATSN